jgi:GTPase
MWLNETLKDLGVKDKPTITVFNKIDAYHPILAEGEHQEPLTLDDFRHSWMAKNNSPAIFISATEKENIEEFRKMLYDKVVEIHTARYPYDQLLY